MRLKQSEVSYLITLLSLQTKHHIQRTETDIQIEG